MVLHQVSAERFVDCVWRLISENMQWLGAVQVSMIEQGSGWINAQAVLTEVQPGSRLLHALDEAIDTGMLSAYATADAPSMAFLSAHRVTRFHFSMIAASSRADDTLLTLSGWWHR